jgi:hypothetical protein
VVDGSGTVSPVITFTKENAPMNRLRRWSVVYSVLFVAGVASADDKPAPTKAGEEKWLTDRSMTVTPSAEPRPALKYRLLPLASELREGNAVPIYLRTAFEVNDSRRKEIMDTPTKWNELPLDQVPLGEAHKFLGEVRGKYLSQLDYGARRRTAEWNYTLEQPDPIGILLPDVQQMRQYAPMLVLRARVDVAEGKYEDAARAFQTGLVFSRHVADGPFLISGLVGIAIGNLVTDRIPEWIERPDSPNLYWSLTALPRPMINLRNALELEQTFALWQFPDLADVSRPRAAAEWDAALKRFRTELRRIERMDVEGNPEAAKLPATLDPDEPAEKSQALAAARRYLVERLGKPAAEVQKMPTAQALLLYAASTFADARDDVFKITYLPFAQAHGLEQSIARQMQEITERLRSNPAEEGLRLARMFLPAISKVLAAQVRLDRKIAMLRTIEALRLHAAANGGQLPSSLDRVTMVPVPLDPGTGKPFEYHLDGATATLISRVPGLPDMSGLRYRITVRK